MTPRQRKAEAVKRKLDNELVDLSLDIVQEKRMANKRLIKQKKHNLPIKR